MKDDEKRIILEELGNLPEDMYDELVLEFIALAGTRLRGMKSLHEALDFAQLAKEAHFIKGASLNLRLHKVHHLAAGMERLSKEAAELGDGGELPEYFSRVEKEIAALMKEFSPPPQETH
jgi:HPt (histidine-containing phosphotransfer) domain-containing protein